MKYDTIPCSTAVILQGIQELTDGQLCEAHFKPYGTAAVEEFGDGRATINLRATSWVPAPTDPGPENVHLLFHRDNKPEERYILATPRFFQETIEIDGMTVDAEETFGVSDTYRFLARYSDDGGELTKIGSNVSIEVPRHKRLTPQCDWD
ncbi:hypothetical protein [Halosegnis longus]|uniref:hypothetical protein n=1 Tax=Halosegnis longus TaxID=2216012 RepID=UPI00129EF582|nr:hypothetical protein [Halosegnis longus]